MYAKLMKLKKPKAPEGVMDIANPCFFSIRPRDSLKTYYFGVPNSERSLWIGYMNDARDGMNRFREALRLKRGATASVSSSSATLFGNLQPIGNTATFPNAGAVGAGSPSGSISSTESSLGGSYTSFGPSSGRSFQSGQSLNSNSSGRSNTTNSSTTTNGPRLTTIESGTMPGTLAHHSASAPPARNFTIASPTASPAAISPRSRFEDDPFGLAAHHHQSPAASESQLTQHQTSPSQQQQYPSAQSSPSLGYTPSPNPALMNPALAGGHPDLIGTSSSSPAVITSSTSSPSTSSSYTTSSSPAPVGTTVLTALPQPVIFSNQTSIRDSFVFDSAL